MKVTEGLLAYCALNTGFSMMSRAFNFYYVKVFLNYYHVQESWFHVAQLLYMVWNAVNDPLFALLQDNTNWVFTRTRREGILYSAPFFALSFLIPWFQILGTSDWAVGLHLILALCLYDTMFTFVGLLSCCLFTEISTHEGDRLKLTRFATVAGLISAQSVLLIEFTSDSLHNFAAFQVTTVVIAVCACCLMVYAGIHGHTMYANTNGHAHKQHSSVTEEPDETREPEESFWRKSLQIFKEPNFISFVIVNFFQGLHAAYLSGFTVIFCDYLVPTDRVPASVRSAFYGMTGTLGGLLVIFGTPLIGRIGYFRAIRYNFVWKVFGGLTMYFLGPSNPWLVMLFILLDTSFGSATFHLFNFPLADIADHDKEKYNRKHPISSTVFGNNALVTKPAQSIAPMLIVAVLNRYGYQQLKSGLLPPMESQAIKDVMFLIICLSPVLVGFIQYLVWSQFTIYRKTREQNVVL